MNLYQKTLIVYAIAINSIAYIIMWYDKYQSKKKGSRVPEKILFLLAFILGAFGIYLGMKFPLYHKSAKPLFKIGIPVLIILNILIVFITINSNSLLYFHK